VQKLRIKMTKMTSPGPGLFFILILLSLFFDARSQSTVIDDQTKDPEIGIIEHLDEFIPDNIYLMGEDSQKVVLTDLIDKPTVLNFVYYRCPGICSPLMEGLADVMNKSDLKPGEDYQVLTISFDPTETIDLAVRKKANYLNLTDKKEEIAKGWKFFVSDSASIAKAAQAVGFKYKKTGNDFLHAASVIVVSPKGKITRYLNGLYFLPFEFKMAVIEAGKGTSGPTINKILQYCYSYDPKGQTYVLNVTKLSGTLILFFALTLFLFLIIKRKRKTI
jgi:protein SCO1/2